jgi:hypothetical protein
MGERGTEPSQETRQREPHPQDLASGRQCDRLDACRHEFRPASHGSEPNPRVGVAELAQETRDVGLVTGPPSPEDVGVDNHERLAHAAAASR